MKGNMKRKLIAIVSIVFIVAVLFALAGPMFEAAPAPLAVATDADIGIAAVAVDSPTPAIIGMASLNTIEPAALGGTALVAVLSLGAIIVLAVVYRRKMLNYFLRYRGLQQKNYEGTGTGGGPRNCIHLSPA